MVDLEKDLEQKIRREFYLLRADLLVNQDLWNDFHATELFLKLLAVREYLLCPQGMEQIASLSADEKLQLYAATDLYQSICNRMDETGYVYKAQNAVEMYCSQLGKEVTDDQRRTKKAERRALP